MPFRRGLGGGSFGVGGSVVQTCSSFFSEKSLGIEAA